MRVTIKDIARKVGVSHATVSRALNAHPAIPESTAAHIRQVALEMGYLPSAAARGLKTHRSHVVGVVVSRFDDPYFGDVLRGVEDVLRKNGYSLFVASFDSAQASERDIVRALGEHAVDGVLFLSIAFSAEYAALLQQYDIPWVVINNQSPDETAFSITHNDLEGSRQVVRHLVTLGHTCIAYMGNVKAGRTNEERLSGFCLELSTAGKGTDSGVVINCRGGEVTDGMRGARELLALQVRPTAIYCFNDLMAIGVLHELQSAGLAVPGDISVAGFDNIPFAALTNPPLTTFDQPRRQIGAEAAQMMLDRLAQPTVAEPVQCVLCGSLQVRASTASPSIPARMESPVEMER